MQCELQINAHGAFPPHDMKHYHRVERLHADALFHVKHLELFTHTPPEVLILGTGRRTCFPDEAIRSYLRDQKIGFECMDSRSAARTYNILVAEGRPVSAALLLPGTKR